jgi:hypothetical protein
MIPQVYERRETEASNVPPPGRQAHGNDVADQIPPTAPSLIAQLPTADILRRRLTSGREGAITAKRMCGKKRLSDGEGRKILWMSRRKGQP